MTVNTKQEEPPTPLPAGWLSRWPWMTFLLPMIVYMSLTQLEPIPPEELVTGELVTGELVTGEQLPAVSDSQSVSDSNAKPSKQVKKPVPLAEDSWEWSEDELEAESWLSIQYRHYPYLYTCKIFLTVLAMILVWPGYRTFRWHLSPWGFVVGVVGVFLWVGICHLDLEAKLVGFLGLDWFFEQGQRSAFNPLVELSDTPRWAQVFLGIRFFGLALVVPIMEEFFLRGFMMRYVISIHWWEWPFGKVIPLAVLVGTGIPMLMHPGELLAAFVWFSLVTCLMVATRNIWDCVIAHATTNLLLGIYVVTSGQWQLM